MKSFLAAAVIATLSQSAIAGMPACCEQSPEQISRSLSAFFESFVSAQVASEHAELTARSDTGMSTVQSCQLRRGDEVWMFKPEYVDAQDRATASARVIVWAGECKHRVGWLDRVDLENPRPVAWR